MDHVMSTIAGAAVTACESLWDGLVRARSAGSNMGDKKRAIECMDCRQRIEATSICVR